jgi:hypothetical protein
MRSAVCREPDNFERPSVVPVPGDGTTDHGDSDHPLPIVDSNAEFPALRRLMMPVMRSHKLTCLFKGDGLKVKHRLSFERTEKEDERDYTESDDGQLDDEADLLHRHSAFLVSRMGVAVRQTLQSYNN